MDVFLFRHGDALAIGEEGVETDFDRPLSGKGKKQVRRAAEGLRALYSGPVHVWTSPLVRARQTADLVAEIFEAGEPTVVKALSPGGHPADLERLDRAGRHVLVGHEPSLSEWASWLLVGATGRVRIDLPKSGCIVIEAASFAPAAGTLLASIPHKAFAADRT